MRDVTPAKFACVAMASCPKLLQGDEFDVVIGKRIDVLPASVAERVGPDEIAVMLPKGLVKPGDA